ncbi:MAG: multiheme c-type cytochrome [Deltaproteobacteria bacterium]|jgi:predicted CXXCH cytochrome family protein|nr:multiheme c-type cytochrome [Deltaproteobacteria bacterium]
MKMRCALLLAAGLLLLAHDPARAVKGCLDCHLQKEFSGKIVHKPVAEGQCTQCHSPHVAKFKGLLQRQGGDLCYSCHEEAKKSFSQGVQHQPVQEGQCLACHSAHASEQKGLLSRPIAESCFGCHEPLAKKEYPRQHKPFADGNCVACHQPHQADNYQLLKDDGDALCLGCHRQPQELAGHQGFPGQAGGCLSCHNPHGGTAQGLIRANLHSPFQEGCASCHSNKEVRGSALCLSCHGQVWEQMLAPHSHMLAGDDLCVACHSPHASDTVGLLRAPYEQLCRSCHTDTFDRNRRSLHSHPKTEKCTDCHEPHGSQRLVMLNGDGNAICSRCHETQGEFSHPVGSEIVYQRTLRGMNCLTCHDPMGTEYRYHLKLSGKKALCVQCHRSY